MGGVPLVLIFFHMLGGVYAASTISGTGYRGIEPPRSFGENVTHVLDNGLDASSPSCFLPVSGPGPRLSDRTAETPYNAIP